MRVWSVLLVGLWSTSAFASTHRVVVAIPAAATATSQIVVSAPVGAAVAGADDTQVVNDSVRCEVRDGAVQAVVSTKAGADLPAPVKCSVGGVTMKIVPKRGKQVVPSLEGGADGVLTVHTRGALGMQAATLPPRLGLVAGDGAATRADGSPWQGVACTVEQVDDDVVLRVDVTAAGVGGEGSCALPTADGSGHDLPMRVNDAR